MNAAFRSLLIGLSASLATLLLLKPGPAHAERLSDEVHKLVEVYANANAALMKGDVATWARLAPMTKDFVLMSPFGGKPSTFADYPPERIERMGKFFRNGRFQQKLLQAYSADGIIVLVTIETANVEVGSLPAQDWGLRVTSVFRRDGAVWRLAHRHADPLTEDVSLEEAAQLARGERSEHAK